MPVIEEEEEGPEEEPADEAVERRGHLEAPNLCPAQAIGVDRQDDLGMEYPS